VDTRRLGIAIIAAWAVVLGLLNFVRLVYTFSLVDGSALAPQGRVFVYQWAAAIFGLAFLAAAWGLWKRANWGRWLFLAVATGFFVTSIVGLFTAQVDAPPPEARPWLLARYILSIILPALYLNLPFIKQSFDATEEQLDD